MKTVKHSKKSHKSSKRAKSKRGTGGKSSRGPRSSASIVELTPSPTLAALGFKVCEEVEVGDIGGFGSTEELEAHEERCTQRAVQFCTSCHKNLCSSHYELLHRDHALGLNSSSQPVTGQ